MKRAILQAKLVWGSLFLFQWVVLTIFLEALRKSVRILRRKRVCCFCGSGDHTQGPTYTRQIFSCWAVTATLCHAYPFNLYLCKLGVMVYLCNPSLWEAKARGLYEFEVSLKLPTEFQGCPLPPQKKTVWKLLYKKPPITVTVLVRFLRKGVFWS